MSELTKEEQIEFIKARGINYIESKYSVSELYEVCREKELISPRLEVGEVDCFGFFEKGNEVCNKCYMAKKGSCKKMQDYLTYFNNFKYNPSVVLLTAKNGVVTMEDSDKIIEKLKLRPDSSQYKIAKIILDSNDSPFSDMIAKIQAAIGPEKGTFGYAKIRFYQTKALLERKADLEIQVLIQKFIHFKKKVKEEDGTNQSNSQVS